MSLLTDKISAGHCAEQFSEQRNVTVASVGDTLGINSTFQVWSNVASNLVVEVGHSDVTQLNSRVVTPSQMQSNWESCFTICRS